MKAYIKDGVLMNRECIKKGGEGLNYNNRVFFCKVVIKEVERVKGYITLGAFVNDCVGAPFMASNIGGFDEVYVELKDLDGNTYNWVLAVYSGSDFELVEDWFKSEIINNAQLDENGCVVEIDSEDETNWQKYDMLQKARKVWLYATKVEKEYDGTPMQKLTKVVSYATHHIGLNDDEKIYEVLNMWNESRPEDTQYAEEAIKHSMQYVKDNYNPNYFKAYKNSKEKK